MHHHPPFSFTGDWIPQNDAFHYWDTPVTCILNMLSKVWLQIWYFWLGFPAGKATIPATFPSQGVLKIAHDSSSGWGVKICPLWCLTKWVLALFTMRAVQWVLVSPSEPQLLGTLQMEFLVCNDIGTSEHVLSTKLEGYFGGYGQSCPSGLHSDIFEFLGSWSWDNPPNKTALFIGTPFLYSP